MPDQEKHYFLTVLLTDKFLQSSLVSNNGQGIQIKEFSEIKAYFDRKDLLEQLDKSLQQLGPDSQDVVETIFAFDNTWLEDKDLSDTKKPIVKEISEELSLDAIGQFSISEAMAEARLIGDEGDSCLLLIFKEDSFDLIFLKHGQFLDLITVGRSGNIVNDFNEVLARASKHLGQEGKYFPNKILMTSIALKQKELESLHDQLVKEDWTNNPGFTQAPNIVVLEADYMIKSVSLSAGKIFTKENFLAKMPNAGEQRIDTSRQEIKPEPEKEIEPDLSLEQVEELKPVGPTIEPIKNQINEDYAVEKPSASSFGIKFDQNYFSKDKEKAVMQDQDFQRIEETKNQSKKKRSPLARFYLAHKKMILLGFAAGLLAVLLIFTIFSFFFSKVKVILTPEQTLLQKNVAIVLDPNIEDSDFSKALLKASLEDKEISGQDVTATTGIGLVGDKAKGKVAIYNKTSEETELNSGTIISSEGIKFLLDETVKVPAATEKDGGSGVDYGKIEVAVTANDIGSEANLNKDTKFRVADYFDDKFSATATDTFSGGSSREVRVVAEVDQSRLLASLSEKLVIEASKELEEESKDGVHLVPTSKTTVTKSDFSAKVGDETESLSLDLSLEVEAVKYLSSDLKQLALAILEEDLPDGYTFIDQDPSLLSDKAQVASGSSKIKLNADLSAKAVASLKLDELKKEVLGQQWSEVIKNLEDKSEIKQVQVIYNPPFLNGILRKLPSDQSRITVELSK
ncbi:hypothetical protein KKI22_01040 [Patescibacteria group bacterium]|nr:hypothetical protein [Patescibacteria group bacterium]